MNTPDELHELSERCDLCRESVRDKLAVFDHRLLALEIVVRGEDGRNGMKAQLSKLCDRFDQFEKKAIRVIAVASALPGIVAAVFAALRFFGSL
jgi:hypothetical protein